MSNVIVVIGPGQIGQAIARRVGVGKHVLLADLRRENADAAAEVMDNAGYQVSVATVDASSREAVHALVETATSLGEVTGLIHAVGVCLSQASPTTFLKVDLYGTAVVLQEFGNVIASGGCGVVIASQSGHRLASARRGSEQGAGHHTGRGTARPALRSAGPGAGLAARLPALQARQLAARDGRSGPLGQAHGAGQHHQPGHRRHSPGQGRAHGPTRRGVPPHDRNRPRSAGPRPPTRLAVSGLTGSDILMNGGVTSAYWYGDLAEVRA